MNQTYKTLPYIICFIAAFFLFEGNIHAQTRLNNASFEDTPSDATTPMGWFECSDDTTPDILPGYWGVYSEPSEGDTYVGMITRENSTFETIGQRLSKPLTFDECYSFSVDLAHSKGYSGYGNPIKLKIYLSDSKCGKDQLLIETPFIDHTEWKKYLVQFITEGAYNYIRFDAFYKKGRFSHKGNILIDNVSPIIVCTRT